MRYINALRLLHDVYGRYPASHRLHTLVRFLTCPFLRTLDVLPKSGRILEIGAGHGIYCYLAARTGNSRQVFAVEPDLRKTLLPTHAAGVRWIAGFDVCIRGAFDAIVVYDATYRMTIEERTVIYRRIFDRLVPGGTFILKDMDPERRLKMRWARLQEWLSDSLLKVSLGSGFIYQTRAEVEATLRAIGFEGIRARRIDRFYPHPHLIYTARKPG
ncbi:MAG TPA: class I SAM-dependent methyltransferase [Thermoanaerobaculia bacterium]